MRAHTMDTTPYVSSELRTSGRVRHVQC
jgi:hypothetical protein